MAPKPKLFNVQSGLFLYKQPEQSSKNQHSLFWNLCGVSVSSPPIVLEAAAVAPFVVMPTAASVVVVAVGVPVFLLVIAGPAVLLMTAGTWSIIVVLIPAGAVLLGRWVLVRGVMVLPGACSDRLSTCRLPLLMRGAAVQLLDLLRVELPHHIHLEMKGKKTE